MNLNNTEKNTRIVFMGTPEFAVPSLKALIDAGYDVPAVVTIPDKPSGRGRVLKPSPVKEFAQNLTIKVLQPEKLKDDAFIRDLKEIQADLIVVVAFRMLPEVVWSMPSLGTFNLHASLLPQYRGAAPINHAIMKGEKETGVTTFFIDHNIDTGKIILQDKVAIDDEENAGSLHDKLMITGAQTVLKTVRLIESGHCHETPQSDLIKPGIQLIPAPKISKEDCRIPWDKGAYDIKNFIRGLSPYPAAFTMMNNEKGEEILVKIYKVEAEYSSPAEPPGTIISDNKEFIKVSVRDGYIRILSLQLQDKKRMDTGSFLSGYRNITSCHF